MTNDKPALFFQTLQRRCNPRIGLSFSLCPPDFKGKNRRKRDGNLYNLHSFCNPHFLFFFSAFRILQKRTGILRSFQGLHDLGIFFNLLLQPGLHQFHKKDRHYKDLFLHRLLCGKHFPAGKFPGSPRVQSGAVFFKSRLFLLGNKIYGPVRHVLDNMHGSGSFHSYSPAPKHF